MAFAQNYKFSGSGTLDFGPAPLKTGSVQAIDAISATQNYALGTRARAFDPVLGEAEFVYCKGAASVAKNELVQINGDFSLTRAAGGTIKGPCGVAQAAIVANRYGWVLVFGRGLVKIAADTDAGPLYATATAGTVADDIVAGSHVIGSMAEVGLDAGGSAVTGSTETTAAHECVALFMYPYVIKAV